MKATILPLNVGLRRYYSYLYVNNDLRQDVKAFGNSLLSCDASAGGDTDRVLPEAGCGAGAWRG